MLQLLQNEEFFQVVQAVVVPEPSDETIPRYLYSLCRGVLWRIPWQPHELRLILFYKLSQVNARLFKVLQYKCAHESELKAQQWPCTPPHRSFST